MTVTITQDEYNRLRLIELAAKNFSYIVEDLIYPHDDRPPMFVLQFDNRYAAGMYLTAMRELSCSVGMHEQRAALPPPGPPETA